MVILACPSMRLTGSMVMHFITRSLSEFHLEVAVGLLAVQEVVDYAEDRLRRRWASWQAKIHLHEFAQRACLLQQRRNAVGWHKLLFICPIDIDPLQQLLHRNRI